jgi:hypothetical protein
MVDVSGGTLRLLDDVRQGKSSLEVVSILCSNRFVHMNKVGHAFAQENPEQFITTWFLMSSRPLWASCLMQSYYAH